ncbi:MAG TPA: dihydrolipoamide acetyltransferase family protein [Vicinamibacterales bacterium]|nr:dihydrolipoamide acetyltransferase family protein [Vicinamibacterales bacterium]
MATDVVMPQMGESIAEGTIVRWIKKVGDSIDKDEPLFEISTDKVDAEIPAPGTGVLLEIRVKEGETVPVNSVVAIIGAAGEKGAATGASGTSGERNELTQPASSASSRKDATGAAGRHLGPDVPVVLDVPDVPAQTLADLRRTRSSPLVRKIAKTHGIDITGLNGSGLSGRVTKKDILAVVEGGGAPGVVAARPAGAPAPAGRPVSIPPPPPAFAPGENVRIEKMSVMRKKIADHMVMSVHTSPHVYSAYEVDFGKIDEIRVKRKAEYEAAGAKLTYTAFIAKATVDTIRQFPYSNASIDGDNVVLKRDINLGIAVALEQGLIVPVIKNADEKNMLGLCRAIQDLANRARTKQLKPEDVQGGTFTITNPGIFGAVFGLPIISQPQVAILGVGSVDKRVVVVNDMIAIRPMCYLTLGYDHRLIDGADAGRFLMALKDRLQNFDESWM